MITQVYNHTLTFIVFKIILQCVLTQKTKAHKFKPGMKLEVADLEQPQIIRVATITNIMGRMLQLFFDRQSKFQFVDFESPDIYPIGWCKRTGHTLHSPFGPSKCLYVVFSLPKFHSV